MSNTTIKQTIYHQPSINKPFKMHIYSTKVLAGFRLAFTNDDKWIKFCEALDDYINKEDEDSDSHSDSDSDCEDCEDCEDDCENDAVDNVWDNLHVIMCEFREKYPNLEYHANKYYQSKEEDGMDRTVDIGFELGEFGFSGDQNASDLTQVSDALKNAKKMSFAKTMENSFFWKFCINKKEPQIFSQTDVFCDEDEEEEDRE